MLQKALVIDNNEVFLTLLVHILKKKGLQVLSADDGISALEILQNFKPDIIFTDLIMPGIGGEDLCRIIRGKREFASTILVVISAIAKEQDIDFQAFGADACIAKGPGVLLPKNIDLIVSLANEDRLDVIRGMILGTEHLHKRSIAKELLDVKHHHQLVFDNIDNGIIEFTDTEKIIYCNRYVARLFHKEVSEILGIRIRDLFEPDAYHHVAECVDQFFDSRDPVECEYSVPVEAKHIVFKLLHVSEKGDETSIMIIRDITKERRIRDRLRKNLEHMETLVAERTVALEQVYRELHEKFMEQEKTNQELEFVARQWNNTFDTISDFVSVHDKDMKFVRVNKALAAVLDKDPDELIGKYCYESIHGLDEPWENCPHNAAIKHSKPVTEEINDEQLGLPLLVTCSPLLHDDGSILGTVHVARDISEEKKATELQEQLIKKLEDSLAQVKQLSGFLPICASCKKIRDDKGYWRQIESYIRERSEAEFSHGICPDCHKKLYPDLDIFDT